MNTPSQIRDPYTRLGVSRASCTQEHVDYMYMQKCMAWNPEINRSVKSEVDIDAIRDAYTFISMQLAANDRLARLVAAPVDDEPVGPRTPKLTRPFSIGSCGPGKVVGEKW